MSTCVEDRILRHTDMASETNKGLEIEAVWGKRTLLGSFADILIELQLSFSQKKAAGMFKRDTKRANKPLGEEHAAVCATVDEIESRLTPQINDERLQPYQTGIVRDMRNAVSDLIEDGRECETFSGLHTSLDTGKRRLGNILSSHSYGRIPQEESELARDFLNAVKKILVELKRLLNTNQQNQKTVAQAYNQKRAELATPIARRGSTGQIQDEIMRPTIRRRAAGSDSVVMERIRNERQESVSLDPAIVAIRAQFSTFVRNYMQAYEQATNNSSPVLDSVLSKESVARLMPKLQPRAFANEAHCYSVCDAYLKIMQIDSTDDIKLWMNALKDNKMFNRPHLGNTFIREQQTRYAALLQSIAESNNTAAPTQTGANTTMGLFASPSH